MLKAFVAFFCSALISGEVAFANTNCREDPRTVQFDTDNTIRLKSYSCSTGDRESYSIKVEFYRVSDPAAGLIVERRLSEMLTKTIGSPRIIENEILKTYAEWLKHYGEARGDNLHFRLIAAGKLGSVGGAGFPLGGLSDNSLGSTFKALLPTFGAIVAGGAPIPHSDFYPAIDEIAAIKRKHIPNGMKLFYSSSRQEQSATHERQSESCKQYSKMIFWRGMQSVDVKNYEERLRAYNRAVGHFTDVGEMGINSFELPVTLELLHHLAGDGPWPEDFTILLGASNLNTCGELLQFAFLLRSILLDVVTVENISDRPITVDGILGSNSLETKLRTSSSFPEDRKLAQGELPLSLAPGEKLLWPTRINLNPSDDSNEFFGNEKHSIDVFRCVGANGFSGEATHGSPKFNNYEVGRGIRVSGIYIDGNKIVFQQRSANFVDDVLGWGMYSCPYLLSWDSEEQQWINHGKILDAAKTRQHQYTHVTTFAGFRNRFRLQEREPEVAFIDEGGLILKLKNGNSISLKSDNAAINSQDGEYIRLYWGEHVDFEFELPKGLEASSVEESKLIITGYYEPYSNNMTRKSMPTKGMSGTRTNYCTAN
jgi:hypothetical protein